MMILSSHRPPPTEWTGAVRGSLPPLHRSLLEATEASAIIELRGLLDRVTDEAPELAEHLSKLTQDFHIHGIRSVLASIETK